MRVAPIIGEPLRFRVQSETNPRKWYLVELGSRQTQCDCVHYLMRIAPTIYNSRQRVDPCKHGQAALLYFAMQMLERIESHETTRSG